MKVVIPGGSGQVGTLLAGHFVDKGDEVVVLSRGPGAGDWRTVRWDGETLGDWKNEIDGAEVVINLAGRSVNCRYNPANRKAIIDSRVLSTRVVGEAIATAKSPPAVWLQASTATIYRHTLGEANDDVDGVIGGDEPGAPDTWNFSIDVAKRWEAELQKAETPRTRKVAMRSAMVMSAGKDGIFDTLATLARRGFGGSLGGGKQFVSWIHGADFARAVDFLIEHKELDGALSIAAPIPLPQREFMRVLRDALGVKIGLPATKWMLEIGALLMGTETELILKSRRVVARRLVEAGFRFEYPEWEMAVRDLESSAVHT